MHLPASISLQTSQFFTVCSRAVDGRPAGPHHQVINADIRLATRQHCKKTTTATAVCHSVGSPGSYRLALPSTVVAAVLSYVSGRSVGWEEQLNLFCTHICLHQADRQSHVVFGSVACCRPRKGRPPATAATTAATVARCITEAWQLGGQPLGQDSDTAAATVSTISK